MTKLFLSAGRSWPVSLRADAVRLTEAQLRHIVRRALRESADDIRDAGVRLRVMVSKPSDPTVPDILAYARGILNVTKVTQVGPMEPAPEGKNWLNLEVSFIDDETYDLPDLIKSLRALDGVDMVRVWEIDSEGNTVTQ